MACGSHNALRRTFSLRPAFTLVELLTVISIVALLVALLMPSLDNVRELTRRAVCAAQIGHQHLAATEYADDGAKHYPPGVCVGHWPFGGMTTEAGQPDKPAGQAILIDRGYLDTPDQLYCPSARYGSAITQRHHWRPQNWNSTFFGYPYWGPYWSTAEELDDLLARTPLSSADTVFSADLTVTNEWWWQSNHKDTRGEATGGNVLYNDGHAKWRSNAQQEPRLNHAGQVFFF